MSIFSYAQTDSVSYRVLDKNATYRPKGKEYFNPGDTIAVQPISLFRLQKITKGKHLQQESQKIEFFSGTFEIADLYARAEKKRKDNGPLTIGGKIYTASASTRPTGDKSLESTVADVVMQIRTFMNDANTPYQGYGVLTAIRQGNDIEVCNNSGHGMYVDLIWITPERCFSALSYERDFESYFFLEDGETCYFTVENYIQDPLYVIGTPIPVAYNKVFLNEAGDFYPDGDAVINISIDKIAMGSKNAVLEN